MPDTSASTKACSWQQGARRAVAWHGQMENVKAGLTCSTGYRPNPPTWLFSDVDESAAEFTTSELASVALRHCSPAMRVQEVSARPAVLVQEGRPV